jgi:CDP-paratose 2-epimerase
MPARQRFGIVEWFRTGEVSRTEEAIAGMEAVGASYLRTHLSWAQYHAPGGREWYDWLVPALGRRFELLPCVHYTPPSISRTGRSSGAPARLKDYADFIDLLLTRYGEHFPAIELWNEPNNLLDWDWREDRDWLAFCEMVGGAAYWAQHRGWRAVLGGPCPFDPHWLALMGERGVLGTVSAVGFHGFPGTWDSEQATWEGFDRHLGEMRAIVDRYNPHAELWITETGYSTWRHDESEQVRRFRDVMSAPAERVYWYGWQDLPRDVPVQEGLYFDARHYHLGLTDVAGRPKLLRRLLERRDPAAFVEAKTRRRSSARRSAASLVIGGAGFIGSNLADALLRDGEQVVVFDNLHRPGVERNLQWLRRRHPGLRVALGDVRDPSALAEVVGSGIERVFHLAAQVAVTSSLADPQDDFAVNATGTFNVLEAMRRHAPEAPLVFASTNKVYGGLDEVTIERDGDRYAPADRGIARWGIGEDRPIDFCTPYGCSKGAADQYVLDYARSFGLRTAVLRMSCIYGPRQFGTEDQGWVAHFLIRALQGRPITIYGDGRQVRDILHVADAVAAYRALSSAIDRAGGQAFNLGGGPANAVSLRMVLEEAGRLAGQPPSLAYSGWRTADQLYFVSDTRRLAEAIGWRARISWRDGLASLAGWIAEELGARPAAGQVRSMMEAAT